MTCLLRTVDRIVHAFGLVGGWLLMPLIIATCYEVVARYAFRAPTVWAYELGYMLTGTNFLLGMAYALQKNAHIRVDVLYQRYSPRTAALVNALTYLIIVIPFSVWLSTALWHFAFQAWQTQEGSGQSSWNPIVWPFRAVFFLAFVMLILQAFAELLRCAQVLLAPRAERRAECAR